MQWQCRAVSPVPGFQGKLVNTELYSYNFPLGGSSDQLDNLYQCQDDSAAVGCEILQATQSNELSNSCRTSRHLAVMSTGNPLVRHGQVSCSSFSRGPGPDSYHYGLQHHSRECHSWLCTELVELTLLPLTQLIVL